MSDFLEVVNASTHNLKNISVKIPKNALTVITGVSGSGKSSLAFDTIYAEGQRKYLESLSTYARMIVANMSEDTHVEEIRGLSPTISISQKTVSSNPRSTVGTITEIYDYLRLLYTTIGRQYCPDHPNIELKKHTLEETVRYVFGLENGTKFLILAPISESIETHEDARKLVLERGYVRYFDDGEVSSVGDERLGPLANPDTFAIVVDRLVYNVDKDVHEFTSRLKESLSLAYTLGDDRLIVFLSDSRHSETFSRKASCPECGYTLRELSISHFSFNSHHGACPDCHGLGTRVTFREQDVVNPALTLAEGAILPWSNHIYYLAILDAVCERHGIPKNIPYAELSKQARRVILYGDDEPVTVRATEEMRLKNRTFQSRYEGIINNLMRRYRESDAADNSFNKRLSHYMTEATCETCGGSRLKPEMLFILVGGKNIGEVTALSVRDALAFFRWLTLSENEAKIAKNILKNIVERLEFLDGVGLDYVTLARRASTLSGGESQRIRLATQIGTKLEGIIYILDEPSIGLHPLDNHRLIDNIKKLSKIGNTLLVVEHDEDIMRAADYVIDIGPGAGVHGGDLVFSGTPRKLIEISKTETGRYLSGVKRIERPKRKLKSSGKITLKNARENNLKHVTVDIPLGVMTVVTGVSGSGKSTLILDTLANAAMQHFHRSGAMIGAVDSVQWLDNVDKAIIIDQSPIGKTPHSNVATYTGVFTAIREVFAATVEAQKRGYKVGRFSFNTKGGRCEVCEGSGVKKIEMHFLPDVYVTCEACDGSRYNRETLEVRYKGKNIAEVLAMTVEEAAEFFSVFPRIRRILDTLVQVGLGYITLGQSAPTFSGGEAQRVKLAFDLAKVSTSKTLYILDEPTTGLHFSDVQKLLDILHELVTRGNSVVVIEHHLDIIAAADHIIDIGPRGGDEGGKIVYTGNVAGCMKCKTSATGEALWGHMQRFENGCIENKKASV